MGPPPAAATEWSELLISPSEQQPHPSNARQATRRGASRLRLFGGRLAGRLRDYLANERNGRPACGQSGLKLSPVDLKPQRNQPLEPSDTKHKQQQQQPSRSTTKTTFSRQRQRQHQHQKRPSIRKYNQQIDDDDDGGEQCARRERELADYAQQQQHQRQPGAAKLAGCWPTTDFRAPAGARARPKARPRRRVKRLLAALLAGDSSRLALLAELLRAPIVLAALFSLLLTLSLLVLYSLSYLQHCHRNSKAIPQQPQLDQRRNQTTGLEHSISARQLAAGARAGAQQAGVRVNPLVAAECAIYEGLPDGRAANLFLGVAYASAPTGARRWSRPRPSWRDPSLCPSRRGPEPEPRPLVRAREHAPPCLQLSPITGRLLGSEDCLYLDIYAPATSTSSGSSSQQLKPVLVYVHGGFLAYGAASARSPANWMRAGPSGRLASELDAIIVAPNYRLQALGFMALSSDSNSVANSDSNASSSSGGGRPRAPDANFGLWDQLVALNWVARNIESFGGDPDSVLLFGPDSAAALPLALLNRRDGGGGKGARPAPSGGSRANDPRGPPNDAHAAPAATDDYDDDHELTLEAGRLFRAVWLANPSLYYELPVARAARHYARLVESQSSCGRRRQPDSGADQKLDQGPNQGPDQQHQHKETSEQLEDAAKISAGQLECLMQLEAGRVVREYLGQDDAAFRLDDQSSLPIRSIFADQFVATDGRLVQAHFPSDQEDGGGGGGGGGGQSAAATAPNWPARQANHGHSLANESAHRVGGGGGGEENKDENKDQNKDQNNNNNNGNQPPPVRLLLGSSTQAVEYWPCPRDLYQWGWADFERYVGASLNSFSQATFVEASGLYGGGGGGDSARTGDPVETYLTMVTDIRQVCPINELARLMRARRRRQWRRPQPAVRVERYIVDWRPSSQLAASLERPAASNCGLAAGQAAESGHRAPPRGRRLPRRGRKTRAPQDDAASSRLPEGNSYAADLATAKSESESTKSFSDASEEEETLQQQQQQTEAPMGGPTTGPKYAFHYWDLMAFFGFEFDPQSRPSETDLEFQRKLRHLVGRLARRGQRAEPEIGAAAAPAARSSSAGDDLDLELGPELGLLDSDSDPNSGPDHHDDGFILFARNNTLLRVAGERGPFRREECKVWQRHLKQSYAWLS